jgi:hypothetical protein
MSTNKIFIPYYISNNTGAPAQVLPRVFFYNGLKESDPYWIQYFTVTSSVQTVTAEQYSSFPYFDNYSGQETTTSSLSLLFLNEDPVYGDSAPSQSLYDLYWAKYIDLLYNPRTRIIRLSAVLPFPVYQKLELNDIIQLRSNYYHLRAINDYNLRTGECRMELLGPLLEGSLNNQFSFDNTCEQAPTLYGSVINDTGSRTITFAITGSNCCNNPNYVTVRLDFTTGSCPSLYYNTQISASVQRNNCTGSLTGSFVLYTVSASSFSSSVSQPAAQASASAYFTATSQSYANTNGTCTSSSLYYNTAISASIQRNDCTGSLTGSFVNYVVSASSFSSSVDQPTAQASASAYFNSTSQSYANTNGTCTSESVYYNTLISASIQRNDCTGGATGSFVTYTISASVFSSSVSQPDAQSSASLYFNSTSQSYANTNGTCSATGSYYTFRVYRESSGYSDSGSACTNQPTDTYNDYYASQSTLLTVTRLFSDTSLITPFVGGDQWYAYTAGGTSTPAAVAQISNGGILSNKSFCP